MRIKLEENLKEKNKVKMCTCGGAFFNFSLILMCFDINKGDRGILRNLFLIHQDHSRECEVKSIPKVENESS